MIRSIAAAILASAALLGAAGVQAQPTGGYYTATPATAPAKDRLITRSTSWTEQNGTLVAARAPERDMILCQLVVRQAGALTAFTVAGKAYDAAQLEKCNGKAATIATAAANN